MIKKVEELSNEQYDIEVDKIPMRVIADHIRALTFAIADGAVPGNDGRGFVLRGVLRRAARFGRELGFHEPFLFKLVDILVKTMSDVFPEIKEKKDYIKKVIKAEEESLNAQLDRAIDWLNSYALDTIKRELLKRNEYIIEPKRDKNDDPRNRRRRGSPGSFPGRRLRGRRGWLQSESRTSRRPGLRPETGALRP